MNIEVLEKQPCEQIFSSRDCRYSLLIDGYVQATVVRCEHRDHRSLGDLKIEKVVIKDQSFYPSNFEELPEAYREETIYSKLIQVL